MEDYKPNSYRSKELTPTEETPEKKIEKVILGSAKTKKKTMSQKFLSVFMPEDVGNMKSYIFTDVLVPSAKKIVSEVVDTVLYGESGRSKNKSNSATRVSYGRYYDTQDRRRDSRQQTKNAYSYDDIIFDSRGDAEAVLDAMNEIIDQYHVVSVGDLYDLADVSTNNFTVNKYGWTDISGCKAVRVRDGYILRLPKALPID